MKPTTIINWVDQTNIAPVVAQEDMRPLGLAVFSADRGPEDMRRVSGDEFYKLYGYDVSFLRHGQPLLQAANWIQHGGDLACKRIVAPDSYLANLIIVARVKGDSIQKTTSDGEALYIDAVTGEETTEAEGNEPVMVNTAVITYETQTVEEVKTMKEVLEAASALYSEGDEESVFPLFVITDNGRGESTKRFSIVPDYTLGRSLNFMLYAVNYIGSTKAELEYVRFATDSNKTYANESYDFNEQLNKMLQLNGQTVEDNLELFVEKISEITGHSVEELHTVDLLLGYDRRVKALDYIKIGEGSVELNREGGFKLENGSNGSFGKKPMRSEDYAPAMVEFFESIEVQNQDHWQFDVCLDANYPLSVKAAIIKLVTWRKDFMYLRDFGLDCNTFEAIKFYYDGLEADEHSAYVANYCQSVEVIDPFYNKRDRVTIPYLFTEVLVPHLNYFRSAPLCGIGYGFTFPNVVKGSLNYEPAACMAFDHQEEFDQMGINFALYHDDVLTMQTEYTAYTGSQQLRYINNVLAVQDMIHDIRIKCPRYRYQFINKGDVEDYRKRIEDIVKSHGDKFDSLEFAYTQDETMLANKIFAASIYVTFKDFVQTEMFDIYSTNVSA